MAPTFRPLHDEGIGPRLDGGLRLLDVAHGDHGLDPDPAQLREDGRARQAEGEGHDRHLLAQHEVELAVPVIRVAGDWLGQLHPKPFRLAEQALPILRNGPGTEVTSERSQPSGIRTGECVGALGNEEIDAQGARRRVPHVGDLAGELARGEVAAGQEAESARLRDCDGELRSRRATCHRRPDDGHVERADQHAPDATPVRAAVTRLSAAAPPCPRPRRARPTRTPARPRRRRGTGRSRGRTSGRG